MIPFLLAACIASPPSYSDSYSQAIREGRPLVVFVGVPAMPGPWLAQEVRSLPGLEGKGVVVSRPRDGFLEWVDTLDWWTDADAIARRIRAIPAPPVAYPVSPPLFVPSRSFVAPRPAFFASGGSNC